LYNMFDKLLILVNKFLGNAIETKGSMTRGLVEDDMHVILPSITPKLTLLFTLLSIIPSLIYIWKENNFRAFLKGVIYCSLCSFMFGWHVHEKAILMTIIPMSLQASSGKNEARWFIITAIVGHFSLFPLLFNVTETPIKFLFLWIHAVSSTYTLYYITKDPIRSKKEPENAAQAIGLTLLERIYLYGLILIQAFYSIIHPLLFHDKYPFLPLLLVSVYCAIGLFYVWVRQLLYFIQTPILIN